MASLDALLLLAEQYLGLLLPMLVALGLGFSSLVMRRRSARNLRPIAAWERLPGMLEQAAGQGRPLHLSTGGAGLQGSDTLLALAGAELVYQAARQAQSPVILTTSATTMIPLGYDMLRRAQRARGFAGSMLPGTLRWFPGGSRSLAWAGAASALMGSEGVGVNLLAGNFGPELALVSQAAARHGQDFLAVSDRLDGQAVAWATGDEPLIGEELFFAGAWLNPTPGNQAALVMQDTLRWLLIAALVGLALVTWSGGAAPA